MKYFPLSLAVFLLLASSLPVAGGAPTIYVDFSEHNMLWLCGDDNNSTDLFPYTRQWNIHMAVTGADVATGPRIEFTSTDNLTDMDPFPTSSAPPTYLWDYPDRVLEEPDSRLNIHLEGQDNVQIPAFVVSRTVNTPLLVDNETIQTVGFTVKFDRAIPAGINTVGVQLRTNDWQQDMVQETLLYQNDVTGWTTQSDGRWTIHPGNITIGTTYNFQALIRCTKRAGYTGTDIYHKPGANVEMYEWQNLLDYGTSTSLTNSQGESILQVNETAIWDCRTYASRGGQSLSMAPVSMPVDNTPMVIGKILMHYGAGYDGNGTYIGYGFGVEVMDAKNIVAGEVTTPAGRKWAMEIEEGEVGFDLGEGSLSPADLTNLGIISGTYQFVFKDHLGNTVSTVVDMTLNMPEQVPNITYPANGATNVDLNPEITWDPVWDGNINTILLFLEDDRDDWDMEYWSIDPAATSQPVADVPASSSIEGDLLFANAHNGVTAEGINWTTLCYTSREIHFNTGVGRISDHVFCIEISHAWDYEDPGVPDDLTYEVEVGVATDDTVELVEFQTPTGVTLQIPKLPGQWDDVNKVWTQYYFDPEENWYWWEYGKDLPSPADMANYDGTYTITVHYSDGSRHQTTVWFGIPNTPDPIPQPTQVPVFVVPQHHESIDSPVTFEWQQCTDPAVSDSNGIWIYLMREGTDEETEGGFDKTETSWGPVDLAQGFWEAEIDFERWYEYVNDDGIEVEVGKYSESDYEFAVDTPWTAYDVFGGNIDHTADQNWWEYYYSIDRQSDYQKLDRTVGLFGQTATFFGDQQYNYYVIAAREELFVDSIRGQWGSYYYGNYPSGNTSDMGNITGPPDGQYATIGPHPTGGTYSGFVIISNQSNGSALTVITDIPGISVSGRVTDKATLLPLTNMRVNCRHLDTEIWTEVRTDTNGFYEITHQPPGEVQISARPEQGSGYGGLKVELELTGDVNDLNFALPLAGRISGTVKDLNNNPVPNLWVYANEYESNLYYDGDRTDVNGNYEITTLPPGTYRVEAGTWDTDYIRQFYDRQTDWDEAARVSVTAGEETTDIDFTLMVGASISGFVKNLTADGIENVRIDCSVNEVYYAHGITTDSNGFYKASGLLPGYSYRVAAYPPGDTDYMITRIHVDVPEVNNYMAPDIVLESGALTVSGRVTDKATSLPLADMRVGCWHEDLEIWTEVRTDGSGFYELTHLPPGWVEISVRPEQGSGYAGIGAELELTGDLSGLDFALAPGAILSGRVIDIETTEPLENIEVTYWSDRYAVWQNDFTDSDGGFTLTNLPGGMAEVMASPEVDTGYARSLPWGPNWVYLDDGEHKSARIITLRKGAPVSGYMKYADGSPAGGIEYDYFGKMCEGWGDTDIDGRYEVILPPGRYTIGQDMDEGFGTLPAEVTITDITQPVNVPDIIIYTEQTGGRISGTFYNPGGYNNQGGFFVMALKAGTVVDADTWYTISPVSEAELDGPGPFTISALPPGNYDVHLIAEYETPDEIESIAGRDSMFNVPVGTTGIDLTYDSQGSTVTGQVVNSNAQPVMGATVLFNDLATGAFGFAYTDNHGEYTVYNMSGGTYTAAALHSKYLDASTTVQVVDGETAYVDIIITPFSGEKEGADLNGDGIIDVSDMAVFAGQWLNSGPVDSNFDQQGNVDLADFSRVADNWYWQAIWRTETQN